VIPGATQFTGFRQRALFDRVLQIPGRRRARGLADADVILGAQATFKAVDALAMKKSTRPIASVLEPTVKFGESGCSQLQAMSDR